MHIQCPNCNRRYVVNDAHFRDSPIRQVRCIGCEHVWTHKNVQPPLPTPLEEVTASPLFTSPPKRSWSTCMGWFIWILCVSALTSGYMIFHQELIRLWPPLSRLDTLMQNPGATKDLHVCELGHYIHLGPLGRELIITGVLENKGMKSMETPLLFMHVTLPETSESAAQSVSTIPLSDPLISPQGRIFFESFGIPLPPKGTRVSFSFEPPITTAP